MRLFDIAEEMKGLQSLVDSGEMTANDIKDTLEGVEASFDDKCRATLKVRQALLGDVAAIDNEIARLNELKKAPQNSADRLAEYLKDTMIAVEKDKLDLGIFRVTLRKASMQLGSVDESKIPEMYFQHIPETKKLDKRALLAAVKNGDTDCVKLIEGKRGLVIK